MTTDSSLQLGQLHLHLLFPEELSDKAKSDCFGLLSSHEGKRFQSLKNPKVKLQYLLTRSLVRRTLAPYLEADSSELSFSYNEHEKPELIRKEGWPNIRFNLSHTDGLICLAVTIDDDIGVDVENITRNNATLDIAQRFFSPAEVQQLTNGTEEQLQDRFFDFWTLKESYIKARGTGLTLPLDKFSFSLTPPHPTVFFEPELKDSPPDWSFRLYSPTNRHRLAIALRNPFLSVTVMDSESR